MQTASARQLLGCSTTGRSDVHVQRVRFCTTAARQQSACGATFSSYSSSDKQLKHCLRTKRRQASSLLVRAESAKQEEARLQADYGALSERIEVTCRKSFSLQL